MELQVNFSTSFLLVCYTNKCIFNTFKRGHKKDYMWKNLDKTGRNLWIHTRRRKINESILLFCETRSSSTRFRPTKNVLFFVSHSESESISLLLWKQGSIEHMFQTPSLCVNKSKWYYKSKQHIVWFTYTQ